MTELLRIAGPLGALMLIPVWIPIIGVVAGAILDQLRPTSVTPAQQVVMAAKERSALRRLEVEDQLVGRRAIAAEGAATEDVDAAVAA